MSKAKINQGKFTVVLRKEKEGGYSVQCLELPGAISEGDTKEQALRNIREAVQGYLEAFPEEAERLKLRKEVVEITL
jgi:predicted RNase H-like HicB family nuclease